jgi:hypothetical protein
MQCRGQLEGGIDADALASAERQARAVSNANFEVGTWLQGNVETIRNSRYCIDNS